MEYWINFHSFPGIFALPTDTVDLYINEASHDDLRVLLYVFRNCCGKPLNEEQMTDALGLSVQAIRKSLAYWAGKDVFSSCLPKSEGEHEGMAKSTVRPSHSESSPSPKQPDLPSVPEIRPEKKVIDTSIQYSASEISSKAKENSEIRFLLESIPEKVGRLISPAECSAIIYLYDGAGLPADVILMVIEYCVSIGKNNMRYIEKTALGWAEEGIVTHELAENKILELEKRRTFEGQVKTMMGISGRALSQAERSNLLRWGSEWSIPVELVKLAYDICVNRTGKLSFSYINSILKSWHEKGISTPEQVRTERKPAAGSKPQNPSFNVDEYVRLSMKRLHDE